MRAHYILCWFKVHWYFSHNNVLHPTILYVQCICPINAVLLHLLSTATITTWAVWHFLFIFSNCIIMSVEVCGESKVHHSVVPVRHHKDPIVLKRPFTLHRKPELVLLAAAITIQPGSGQMLHLLSVCWVQSWWCCCSRWRSPQSSRRVWVQWRTTLFSAETWTLLVATAAGSVCARGWVNTMGSTCSRSLLFFLNFVPVEPR